MTLRRISLKRITESFGLSVASGRTRRLAQLAQFGGGFRYFLVGWASPINRLACSGRRFERVVTTLGIFFGCGHGSDGACTCATEFARRTARSTVIGAWCGRSGRSTRDPADGGALGEQGEHGRIEARALARRLVGNS